MRWLAASYDILQNVGGAGCFGTGCRAPGASSAGITSAWQSRSRTDNDRGMPPNPDWMASRRQVKCVAGGGGDGDRIGGVRVGYPRSLGIPV